MIHEFAYLFFPGYGSETAFCDASRKGQAEEDSPQPTLRNSGPSQEGLKGHVSLSQKGSDAQTEAGKLLRTGSRLQDPPEILIS